MPKLNVLTQVTATIDAEGAQKAPDWKRSVGCEVEQVFVQRALLKPNDYQDVVFLSENSECLWPGNGDQPTFDVLRHPTQDGLMVLRSEGLFDFIASNSIGVIGHSYSIESVGDGTVAFSHAEGSTGLTAGMTVYLAGSQYGDAGPWAAANQGFWTVVRVEGPAMTLGAQKAYLRRADGEVASLGASETVVTVAQDDIQYVQNWFNYVKVMAAGLSGVWEVAQATRNWVAVKLNGRVFDEVEDSSVDAISFAQSFASYVRVESDQPVEMAIGLGDYPNPVKLPVLPVTPGDPRSIGWFEVRSYITDLAVKNFSGQNANVSIIWAMTKADSAGPRG